MLVVSVVEFARWHLLVERTVVFLVVVYQCECDVGSVKLVATLLDTIVLLQCDLWCAELDGEGFGVMIGTFGDTGIHCEVAVGDCSVELLFVNGLYPRHDVI